MSAWGMGSSVRIDQNITTMLSDIRFMKKVVSHTIAPLTNIDMLSVLLFNVEHTIFSAIHFRYMWRLKNDLCHNCNFVIPPILFYNKIS